MEIKLLIFGECAVVEDRNLKGTGRQLRLVVYAKTLGKDGFSVLIVYYALPSKSEIESCDLTSQRSLASWARVVVT